MDKIHFAPSSQRYRMANVCPCGKSNKDGKFCPDKENPKNGYCQGCGKAFFDTPYQSTEQYIKVEPEKEPSFHSRDVMLKSVQKFNENNFLKYCIILFPNADIESAAKLYGVGTSAQYEGNSTVFWQQDINGNIRAGKIIKYDATTGKRQKDAQPAIKWTHHVLKIKDFTLKQCLFGEHLLKGNSKHVALVESEKTAFIMALIDKSRIWVATGGKQNFKYDLLKVLKDRKVTAYPDNGEYETWKNTAYSLTIYGINITVTNKFEHSVKPKGWDLADEVAEEILNTNTIADPVDSADFTERQVIEFGDGFTTKELSDLAELLIPENDSRTENEILRALNKLEGLSSSDGKYLIKIMLYRQIISECAAGYYLNSSTPF